MNGGATRVVALDHEAPADRSNPIGQSAKAGTHGNVSAAAAIVGNLDDRGS